MTFERCFVTLITCIYFQILMESYSINSIMRNFNFLLLVKGVPNTHQFKFLNSEAFKEELGQEYGLTLLCFLEQGYGLTESTAGASRTMDPEEISNTKSVGRLSGNMEAKIVDPASGDALLPNHKGELWLRGPTIMKGEQCSVLLIIFNALKHSIYLDSGSHLLKILH